jgi:hypothetical protein
MWASVNGHLEVIRTLLEAEADVNAKDNVRNQMMMMMIIIIMLLTILIMMLLLMIVIDVFMLIIDNYDDSK